MIDFPELGVRREVLLPDGAQPVPVPLRIERPGAQLEPAPVLRWGASVAQRVSVEQNVSGEAEHPQPRSNNPAEHVDAPVVGMRAIRRRHCPLRQPAQIHLEAAEVVVHSVGRLLVHARVERHVLDIADERACRHLLEGALLRGRILQVI